MKFWLSIVFVFTLYTSFIEASSLPKDRLFHINVSIGQRMTPNSLRLGIDAIELGILSLGTPGIVYRMAKGAWTGGFGIGYGGDTYGPPAPGIFAESGLQYLVTQTFVLRWDFTGFINTERLMRSEMLIGLGVHI